MAIETSSEEILVFTDGGCEPNPGPGAWGAIIKMGNRVFEIGDTNSSTTNNQMELTAALMALEFIGESKVPIRIHSDSNYLIQGMSSWIKNWKKNNWQRFEGKKQAPVANENIWRLLDQAASLQKAGVAWVHTPGHTGIPGNERVDQIAQMLMAGVDPQFFNGSAMEYVVDLHDLKPRHERRKPDFAKRSIEKKELDVLQWFLES